MCSTTCISQALTVVLSSNHRDKQYGQNHLMPALTHSVLTEHHCSFSVECVFIFIL